MQNNLDLELRSIQLNQERMLRGLEELQKLLMTGEKEKSEFQKEFLTIEECWKLKGGCSLNTLKANAFLRVGCGNPKYAHYIGGRLCFKAADAMRWAQICDGPEYIEYAKEYGVTVVPEKYLRLAQKARQKEGVAL